MTQPKSRQASQSSGKVNVTTGDPLFRTLVLPNSGCEITEGDISDYTVHFHLNNNTDGAEEFVSSTLQIDTSLDSLKNIAESFDFLNTKKLGKTHHFLAITDFFLKEIEPFYKPRTDTTKPRKWEPAKLVDCEFYTSALSVHYPYMSLPPLVSSKNRCQAGITSTATTSQKMEQTQAKGPTSTLQHPRADPSRQERSFGNSSSSTVNTARSKTADISRGLTVEHIKGIKPTAVYWLRSDAITLKHQDMISNHTYESPLKLLAPYLTVMVMDASEIKPIISASKILDDLAVIGATALYDRFLLKKKSFQKQPTAWNAEENEQQLRHYGLLFTGIMYRLWCFKAKFSDAPAENKKSLASATGTNAPSTSSKQKNGQYDWNGFQMTEVLHGNLVAVGRIDTLVSFLNAIHQWGLTVHGPGIEKDLNRCFKDEPAGRLSLDGRDG